MLRNLLPPPLPLADARDFCRAMEAFADAQAERRRHSANWQKAARHRWLQLTGHAAVSSFAKTQPEARALARRAVKQSRDPKVKGTLRSAYRNLAYVLLRAARGLS